jgi:hypothetical protein
VEEFKARGMYPLAADAGFDRVATHMTPVSKLKVPLLKFTTIHKDDNKDDVQFLVRVELESEHDPCLAHVRNGGRLNHILSLQR